MSQSVTQTGAFSNVSVGPLSFTAVAVTETDTSPLDSSPSYPISYDINEFLANPSIGFGSVSFGSNPGYSGIGWSSFSAGVFGDPDGGVVQQTLNFTYNVAATPGSTILGFTGLVVANTVVGSADSSVTLNAVENVYGAGHVLLGTMDWNYLTGSSGVWLGTPANAVSVSLTVTAAISGGPDAVSDQVSYSAIEQGYVAGSISIVKEVSVDGGGSWLTIANGATSDAAQALVGCPVEYRVIVTNNSSSGVNFTGSVTDTGIAGLSGFTFGGASSLTLAAGSSETSGVVTVSAGAGDVFDTATVSGVVSAGSGSSGTVTASSSADVTGVNGSVTIIKQISVDGGATWQNGDGNDPAVLQGGTVDFRVIIDNTGTVNLDSIAVADTSEAGPGAVPVFTFATADSTNALFASGTLAAGATVTSDSIGVTAAPGTNADLATVTAKAVIQDGTTGTGAPIYANSICNVTASDTAEYNSVSYNGPNSGITVDKQVFMCGTWGNVGPNALVGSGVEFRVIVTDTGLLAISNVAVTDSYLSGSTPETASFTFGSGSSDTVGSLGVGASVTSNVLGLVAQAGTNIDTANASGTITSGGITSTVTATGTADYVGESGSVAIDKQVSANGSTWDNVATLNASGVFVPTGATDPIVTAGAPVYFRVVVADTGQLAITGASVSDAYSGGTAGFVFGSSSLTTTGIAVGASVTSDILTLTAPGVVGTNWDTATVTGTIADSCGNTATVAATSSADYTTTITSTGSICIDKQVSVDCGKTWVDVGKGVLNDPTASIGAMVEYRVLVTDTGSTGLSNVVVGDANGGAVTGFTFGGVGDIATLAPGQTVTSDAGLTPAVAGHQLDVATATGTVTGSGTLTVTATDTADYTGVKGNITIDKQVSVNGCTWSDVGAGVLQDPTAVAGGMVYYRVIVTDTGSSTITGVKVTDVGNGAPSGFSFGSGCSSSVTLSAGQSITSNVACVTALVGYNTDTATVTGTITSGGGYCGGGGTTTVVGACDVADYTGIKGSLSIDKQVSVNGGTTWQDVGNGVLQSPTALIGSSVEFRVIVTDTGTTAINGITVSDAGGGSVTGFTFGGSGSVSLIGGQSATSDLTGNATAALCGENVDTATATGTITVGSGSATVTTTDKADYKGVGGGVSIDKQVSVDGGKTWLDVGNCSNDPLATIGSTVDFRVVVTDTGGTALSNLSVSDAGNPIKDFTFGGKATVGSLAVGQSITSDIASTTAVCGYQVDTAEVTGTVALGGSTATVSALDTADYTGGSSSGGGWGGSGGCGGGWGGGSGGSGGCGTGWGSGWHNGASNGYGCGSSSSGNLCSDYGQAQKIEFCYSPSDCVSQSGLQSGLACVSGHDGCGTAFVEVTNCANPYATGASCYYEGSVSSGQDFFASCGSASGFSGDCYIHVFSSAQSFDEHQGACQTDTYVANGSQSICLGDKVGCATVVGYLGHSGGWCV